MSEDLDAGVESTAPVWAVFGDLMSVLLGGFVLILLGVIGFQMELSARRAPSRASRAAASPPAAA